VRRARILHRACDPLNRPPTPPKDADPPAMMGHHAVVFGTIEAVDRLGRRLQIGHLSFRLADSAALYVRGYRAGLRLVDEAALPVGASATVAYEIRDGERWAVEVRVRQRS
jgi:hypothetical protein